MIAFLGHSDFGEELLKRFISRGLKISYVTTKKVNKDHATKSLDEFRKICEYSNLQLFENVDVNSSKFVELNKDMGVSHAIIGGYDGIIKSEYLTSVKSVINTHFGIIPRNRGCNPSMWDILSDKSGGYTTYEISEGIDEGRILKQETVEIQNDETSESLYKKVQQKAILGYDTIFDSIEKNTFKHVDPIADTDIYHRCEMPNDRFVSWRWKTDFIVKMYRSLKFGDYPTLRTRLKNGANVELKLLDYGKDEIGAVGSFTRPVNGVSKVFTSDGYVIVSGLQNALLNNDESLVSVSQGIYKINMNHSETYLEDTYFQTKL